MLFAENAIPGFIFAYGLLDREIYSGIDFSGFDFSGSLLSGKDLFSNMSDFRIEI